MNKREKISGKLLKILKGRSQPINGIKEQKDVFISPLMIVQKGALKSMRMNTHLRHQFSTYF